jgi:hypothetical protein
MSDKYKELYELSKYIHEEELGRAHRFDDRASKLLPAYAILIGILGLIIKWYFDNGLPLKNTFDYIISAILFITTASLIVGLCATIRVFTKAHDFNKLAIDDSLIKFFSDNTLIDIHYALSKRLKEAYEKNYLATSAKAGQFAKVYFPIITSSILLFISLMLIGISVNNNKQTVNKGKEESAIIDNNMPAKQSNQVPQKESTPKKQSK